MHTGGKDYEVRGGVNFLDDSDMHKKRLAYPVGRQISIRELETNNV